MGARLPEIPPEEFAREVLRCSPVGLDRSCLERLALHYRELRRWNRVLSLVGPGTARDLVWRHYGESLAALPLLATGPGRLVDIGSGAGFPGWVLAAARPDLEVTLIEARERKWAFLESASRKAGLSCRCLNARVGRTLPEGMPREADVVTCRAVKMGRSLWKAVDETLGRRGTLLIWTGGVEPPPGWREDARRPLAGSERRVVQRLRREPPAGEPS